MKMGNPDLKRKREVEKKLFIVTNSYGGPKVAGIFELNIQIPTNTSEVVESNLYLKEEQPLKPIHVFCDQKKSIEEGKICLPVAVVSSCVLGSKLYMFPDDTLINGKDMRQTRTPIIFDLKTRKEEDFPMLLRARKVEPIVMVVGNQLFALSALAQLPSVIPNPCFESLKLDKNNNTNNSWKELACSPFHSMYRPEYYRFKGYAVLGEDFLLVSLASGIDRLLYYSYNFRTNKWKETKPPPNAGTTLECPYFLNKKALVVGNDIYTFHPSALHLIVFSYTHLVDNYGDETEADIVLGKVSRVQGLVDEDAFSFRFPTAYLDFCRTAVIAKVNENGLFCLVHHITKIIDGMHVIISEQGVHVCFVQMVKRDFCKIIKSLTCTLSLGGTQLVSGCLLESCYVLPLDDLEEKSDHHRAKRAVLSNDDDDEEASEMELDCDGIGDNRS